MSTYICAVEDKHRGGGITTQGARPAHPPPPPSPSLPTSRIPSYISRIPSYCALRRRAPPRTPPSSFILFCCMLPTAPPVEPLWVRAALLPYSPTVCTFPLRKPTHASGATNHPHPPGASQRVLVSREPGYISLDLLLHGTHHSNTTVEYL